MMGWAASRGRHPLIWSAAFTMDSFGIGEDVYLKNKVLAL